MINRGYLVKVISKDDKFALEQDLFGFDADEYNFENNVARGSFEFLEHLHAHVNRYFYKAVYNSEIETKDLPKPILLEDGYLYEMAEDEARVVLDDTFRENTWPCVVDITAHEAYDAQGNTHIIILDERNTGAAERVWGNK